MARAKSDLKPVSSFAQAVLFLTLLSVAQGTPAGEDPSRVVVEIGNPTRPRPVSPMLLTPAELVNVIDTSMFGPSSPDPSGLAYLESAGTLLVSDSEVSEMTIYSGTNVWEAFVEGIVVDTSDTTFFSSEPTGIAVDPVSGHWFFSDDDEQAVFEVDLGPDELLNTPDDIVTSFRTLAIPDTAFPNHKPMPAAIQRMNKHSFRDGLRRLVVACFALRYGRPSGEKIRRYRYWRRS